MLQPKLGLSSTTTACQELPAETTTLRYVTTRARYAQSKDHNHELHKKNVLYFLVWLWVFLNVPWLFHGETEGGRTQTKKFVVQHTGLTKARQFLHTD